MTRKDIELDIISSLKDTIAEELNKNADKLIEELCNKFRCELQNCKYNLILGMLKEIDICISNSADNNNLIFQINLKK